MSYKYWLTQKITNKIAFFEKKKKILFLCPLTSNIWGAGGGSGVIHDPTIKSGSLMGCSIS